MVSQLCMNGTVRFLTYSVWLLHLLLGLRPFRAFILKYSVIQWFLDKVSQVLPGFTHIFLLCLILPFAQ